MTTPHNTNPNVLRGMLQEMDKGSGNNMTDEALTSPTFNLVNSTVSYIASSKFYNLKTLETVSCDNVQSIGNYAFYGCTSLSQISFPKLTAFGDCAFLSTALTSVDFPNVERVNYGLFMSCSRLTTARFPDATMAVSNAFADCISLTEVYLPKLPAIGTYIFTGCTRLSTLTFPMVSQIGSCAFSNCSNLRSLYLLSNSVVKLVKLDSFDGTPIASTVTSNPGSVYVPASLYSNYLTASNWSVLSSRIVSLSTEEVEALL